MWVVDLIIEAQRAKQRKERERWWHLDIRGLLKRKHERKIRQRVENVKRRL